MNSYLSKEEKQHFVRATALVALIEETINGYASAKSTDPGFLKYLRTQRPERRMKGYHDCNKRQQPHNDGRFEQIMREAMNSGDKVW